MVAMRHIGMKKRVLAHFVYVIVMIASLRVVGATDQANGEQKEGGRVTKPNVSGLRVVNLGSSGNSSSSGSGDAGSGDSGVLVKTFMMIGGGNSTFLKGVHDMKNKANATAVSGKPREVNKKASSSSGTSLGAQSESMLSFSFVVFTVTAVILSYI
ncbi:hypothetical protein AYI70_g4295 [Smittium culicis]|uniref:Uncharacterized protein n=1 Tax=Smittium culicis TaxID=133412 RepID=A0A1R1XZR9_9FUNG|nr:hypothetical protein AYI70_g5975 [Smittium culicis]OMJ20138.1 hypothetical protein AYI70_g4295 [Smittium culicis]